MYATCPCVHAPTHPPAHQSIHPCIHVCIYPSLIYLCTAYPHAHSSPQAPITVYSLEWARQSNTMEYRNDDQGDEEEEEGFHVEDVENCAPSHTGKDS